MIDITNLATIYLHTKLIQYHWTYNYFYYIPVMCLLQYWRFVSVNPFHLFDSAHLPLLPSGNNLLVLCIYECVLILSCLYFLFYFLDSTYKGDRDIFLFLCLTHFTYCNPLQVHPCCCKWQTFSFMTVVFHVHTYTTSSLSMHLLMDTKLASISKQS